MTGLSVPLLALIFALSAALVWLVGPMLTRATDALSERWGLGEALGGLILLGVVTNLPELAITVSAAISGNMGLAVGNLLGGIPMQLMVLVVLDRAARGTQPLSALASTRSVQVETLFCIVLLAIVVLAPALVGSSGTGAAASPAPARTLGPISVPDVLVVASWIAALLIMKGIPDKPKRMAHHRVRAGAAQTPPAQSAVAQSPQAQSSPAQSSLALSPGLAFALAGGATLLGGIGLEMSSDALSQRFGISGLLFGATVLAAATSLPELTTGLAAIREKSYALSVSDIVGGNGVLVVLLVIGSLLSGSSAFALIDQSAVVLAATGIAMTAVLSGGMVVHARHRIAGLGADSWIMTALFGVGLFGLYGLAG